MLQQPITAGETSTTVDADTTIDGITGDATTDPADDDPSAVLFSLDAVHSVDLTLTDAAIASLYAEPYTYVEAGMSFDGEALDPVAVRIKGRLGSYRDLSGKPALKIDLDRFSDQELHGKAKLNLNNMVQDAAMTHERIAYSLFSAAGVAAPRVGYVWLTINGEDYGLYTNVEVYDERWLARSYADPSGNLYDGDYHLYEDGSYTFVDFNGTSEHLFVLDEGTDVDRADIYRVTDALQAPGADLYSSLDDAVDMDQFLRMWAAEAWVGQYDGYAYNVNNYRVYFDPADGRARLHPWDPDWAFYASTPVTSPEGALASGCYSSVGCRAEFIAAVDAVKETARTAGLEEELDAALALILPYVAIDPRREYALTTVLDSQNDLYDWLVDRNATLDAMGL